MSQLGKFITIEGVEGLGKSTALKFMQSFLQDLQINFLITREPGGTDIAELIRKILLSPNHTEKMQPETELLLMFACRAQHIATKIKPALMRGQWVISDRFIDASYAYQGQGRELAIKKIHLLDEWIVGDLQPDVTILLDAPAHIGLARARKRHVQDRIENEALDFFENVRAGYLARAREYPQRFKIIDASRSLAQVHEEIKQILLTMAV